VCAFDETWHSPNEFAKFYLRSTKKNFKVEMSLGEGSKSWGLGLGGPAKIIIIKTGPLPKVKSIKS